MKEFFKETLQIIKNSPFVEPKVNNSLARLKDCNYSFWLNSANFKSFLSCIDFAHPATFDILEKQLSEDKNSFVNCLYEVSKLFAFAKENSFAVANQLKTIITKHSHAQNIVKQAQNPAVNLLNVRLIESKEERSSIRKNKKILTIGKDTLYERAVESFGRLPKDFSNFVRGKNSLQSEIEQLKNKIEHFKALKCPGIASEIDSNLKELEENSKEIYYGFNRLTMVNCALIYAKSQKFTVDSRSIFALNNFFPFNFLVNDNPYSFVEYQPRFYPYVHLEEIISQEGKDLIEFLENFPEIGNKSLFDHYWVMVPSFNYQLFEGIYSFKDKENNPCYGPSKEDNWKLFDAMLIKEEIVSPVLIGEVDGKCYFINYIF